jgi:glycosyltransferase involved in cell wall biosynthesis
MTTVRRVYKAIGSFVKIPDSMVLWIPGALTAGITILRKYDIDAIYASGPSFTNFPVAIFLKKLFRKPVVLDFRDAWMADPMVMQSLKGYMLRAHQRLERYVVQNADRVISTNSYVTRYFQGRYPSADSGKYDTLYNGFDVEDQISLGDSPLEPGLLHVVYTGRLYYERTPKYFLQALQRALLEKPSMRKTLRVTFVGSCEKFMDGKYIEDYLAEYGLQDVVRLTGHVSRKESLSYEMNADLLLVLIGIVPPEMELTYGISGKIFDYLVSGKPILTLSNGGATREFIIQNRIGSIHYHEDLEGIKKFLINLHDNGKGGVTNQALDIQDYQRFNVRSVTAQLVSHLEAITQH